MYLEGYLSSDKHINIIKAYKHFSYAASNFHAIAFYELYQMTKKGELDSIVYNDYDLESKVRIKNIVSLQYLTFSAEEGYTEAMFELGNSYINNNIDLEKDYYKALAWHRQACRNGYFLSYEICGDLLSHGGQHLKSDKILALAMYNTAFSILGDKDILKKIEKLTVELKQTNQYIPELYAKNNI